MADDAAARDAVPPVDVGRTRAALVHSLGSSFAVDDTILLRPPFRFFHDAISAFSRVTGFCVGLYVGPELDVAAIRLSYGRDAKVLYLRKAAALASMITGEVVSCKPSKIVAGNDSVGANALLCAVAKAAESRHPEHGTFVTRIRAATQQEWDRVFGGGARGEPSDKVHHPAMGPDASLVGHPARLSEPAEISPSIMLPQLPLSARSAGSAASSLGGEGARVGGRPPTAPKRRPQALPAAAASAADNVKVNNPRRASLLLGLGDGVDPSHAVAAPASPVSGDSHVHVGRPSTAPEQAHHATLPAGGVLQRPWPPTPTRPLTPGHGSQALLDGAGARMASRPSTAASSAAALAALQRLAAGSGAASVASQPGLRPSSALPLRRDSAASLHVHTRPLSAMAPPVSVRDVALHAATRSAEEAMLAILIGGDDGGSDDDEAYDYDDGGDSGDALNALAANGYLSAGPSRRPATARPWTSPAAAGLAPAELAAAFASTLRGHASDDSSTCRSESRSVLDTLLAALNPLLAPPRSSFEQQLAGDAAVNRFRSSSAGQQTWPLLHQAIAGGRPDMAALLLGCGADADVSDADGQTPLHLVASALVTPTKSADSAYVLAAGLGLLRILALLARAGGCGNGHLDARDAYGLTPLHVIAQRAHSSGADAGIRALGVLLETGADASVRDRFGDTPGDAAVSPAAAEVLRLGLSKQQGAAAVPDVGPLSLMGPASVRALPLLFCHVARFLDPPSVLAASACCWAACDISALCGLRSAPSALGRAAVNPPSLLSRAAGLRWPSSASASRARHSLELGVASAAPNADSKATTPHPPRVSSASSESEQALRGVLGLPEAPLARTLSGLSRASVSSSATDPQRPRHPSGLPPPGGSISSRSDGVTGKLA